MSKAVTVFLQDEWHVHQLVERELVMEEMLGIWAAKMLNCSTFRTC